MQSDRYWSRFQRDRLTRRRALGGAAALGSGLAALSLVGCGGGEKKSAQAPKSRSDLLSTPVDTTAQAKPGGTLKDFQNSDVQHMDALFSNDAGPVNQISVFAYPRLLKFVPAKSPKVGDYSVEGDTGESYEVSPDKLQITFKVRQGMKWDARPPTSGRPIDAQDVVWSWAKFAKYNGSAANHVYDPDIAPGAPVESVTAPDSKTVVFKLRKPDASELTLLATWDQLYIMPRESESQFDPRNEIRGHGPWVLDEYRPSAYINWKKNPDYYVKDRPFFDRIERPIITQYAQQLAQFQAGNIHTSVVLPQDLLTVKKDVPKTLLIEADFFATTASPYLGFGYEGDSPFKDVRARQATSMSIDREGFADVLDNRKAFQDGGIDLSIGYNTVVGAGWGSYWLDPYDEKAFGPNHKYLKYDVAEAKKLLAAAGHPNGVEFDFIYNGDNLFGAAYQRTREVYTGLLTDVGLKPRLKGVIYREYNENHYGYLKRSIYGNTSGFNGLLLVAERPYATVASLLFGIAHRDGVAFHGATPDGRNAAQGDPKLNDAIDKLRQETDRQKAQSMVHDFIRYYTQQMYLVPRPTVAKALALWWPSIGNVGAFNTVPSGGNIWAEQRLNWWLDTSKPPISRA